MITISISRFVNVRFITNVLTNLVDVTRVASVGSKPAKPGAWCASHSGSYRDSDCRSQEQPEQGCRGLLGNMPRAEIMAPRLMPAAQRALIELAAAKAAFAQRQSFGIRTLLRFNAA